MGEYRRFTDAARSAAIRIRKERQALKAADPNPLEVFVVRAGNLYGWEIRQYGAVLVKKSEDVSYTSESAARVAGCVGLESYFAELKTVSGNEQRQPLRGRIGDGRPIDICEDFDGPRGVERVD